MNLPRGGYFPCVASMRARVSWQQVPQVCRVQMQLLVSPLRELSLICFVCRRSYEIPVYRFERLRILHQSCLAATRPLRVFHSPPGMQFPKWPSRVSRRSSSRCGRIQRGVSTISRAQSKHHCIADTKYRPLGREALARSSRNVFYCLVEPWPSRKSLHRNAPSCC